VEVRLGRRDSGSVFNDLGVNANLGVSDRSWSQGAKRVGKRVPRSG
jgi:hypothetical protein